MSTFLEDLRKKDASSTVAYHLEGLLEAMDSIRRRIAQVDAAVKLDPETLAAKMVELQVEIFDHMGYHMKQLRKPLQRLIDASYEDLPGIDEDEAIDWPQVPSKGGDR